MTRFAAEIERRGGETGIEGGDTRASLRLIPLRIVDRQEGLVLLHCEGWRFYSRRAGSRPASLSYLCGRDDNGLWAVRIPGTLTRVADALAWVTPAEVLSAQALGRRVRRQGDIYAVETTPAHDTPTGWIGNDTRYDPTTNRTITSAFWDATKRTLVHRPTDGRRHRPLRLNYPVRFIQQRTYEMGRSERRSAGD